MLGMNERSASRRLEPQNFSALKGLRKKLPATTCAGLMWMEGATPQDGQSDERWKNPKELPEDTEIDNDRTRQV